MPREKVDNSGWTRRRDSGYDLSNVFDKIEKMGLENIHSVAIAPDWNESNIGDFGNFQSRDIDSKLEVIKGILEEYPELTGRFMVFANGIIGNKEMQNEGIEVFGREHWNKPGQTGIEWFAPYIYGEGTWAKMIQYMSAVRGSLEKEQGGTKLRTQNVGGQTFDNTDRM
ncbi:MAG: hypothetical protein FWE45_04095 [Firmicutes bacterium]|nr:hypothetical protein [Bacillota bacterium]